MSPYGEQLAHARLCALRKLIDALNEAETPDEKRRCAVAIFNAPDPCDLDDEIELVDDDQEPEESDESDIESAGDDANDENEDPEDDDAHDDDDAAPAQTSTPASPPLAALSDPRSRAAPIKTAAIASTPPPPAPPPAAAAATGWESACSRSRSP